MYAIRSYYVQPKVHCKGDYDVIVGEGETAKTYYRQKAVTANKEVLKVNRITSYNVCYTKLLRRPLLFLLMNYQEELTLLK